MVTELAKGRKIKDAQRISSNDIVNALGGLPGESLHCASLATETLKKVIRNYLVQMKETRK
jgi:NifU-like protein involved in Fe-S cluster formation